MWSSLMLTCATFLEEIFASPLQPRGARRKQTIEWPETVMFFAISSRNLSWKTQKLQTAMLWTLLDRKSTRLNSSHCYISYTLFFFNDTATTEIYTLSLHDALPI